MFKLYLIWGLSLLLSGSLYAQKGNRQKALMLWDQAKKHYEQKNYKEASKIFYESHRAFPDSKCLYFYANCLAYLDEGSCGDRISSWNRYLDQCEIEKTCQATWINKAKEKLKALELQCASEQNKIIESKVMPKTEKSDSTEKRELSKSLAIELEKNGSEMKMNTSFFCRFKQGDAYVEGGSCNGETFREGDQVSFSATPLQEGYFYILLFNEAGQAQMLWPEPKDENLLKVNQSYLFPSGQFYQGWWEVDHVKNVTEVVLLILSRTKINSLEELRGKEMLYDPKLKEFIPDKKVERGLVQITEEMKAKEISLGVSELILGSTERVISKFTFKHE